MNDMERVIRIAQSSKVIAAARIDSKVFYAIQDSMSGIVRPMSEATEARFEETIRLAYYDALRMELENRLGGQMADNITQQINDEIL